MKRTKTFQNQTGQTTLEFAITSTTFVAMVILSLGLGINTFYANWLSHVNYENAVCVRFFKKEKCIRETKRNLSAGIPLLKKISIKAYTNGTHSYSQIEAIGLFRQKLRKEVKFAP